MSNVVLPPLHSFCNTAEARRVASYILGYACHDMHASLFTRGYLDLANQVGCRLGGWHDA